MGPRGVGLVEPSWRQQTIWFWRLVKDGGRPVRWFHLLICKGLGVRVAWCRRWPVGVWRPGNRCGANLLGWARVINCDHRHLRGGL